MLLLEQINDSTNKNRSVNMTHQVSPRGEHTIAFWVPKLAAGPFAAELIARYHLSAEQAKELKAHL